MMEMYHIRQGHGPPLLLIHGLGGSWRSWSPVLGVLAAEREVIGVDLPGFGETPPLMSEVSIRTLADAMTTFLAEKNLLGVDAVGSSMGARLVLELARRGGVLGSVVALDPGGFWAGWQRHAFYSSIWTSVSPGAAVATDHAGAHASRGNADPVVGAIIRPSMAAVAACPAQ